MRKKARATSTLRGQNCDPLDEIMISPLVSKVNVPTLLTAAFHRDCFMVEAAFAARHACALHCHKQNVMPACHVPVRVIMTCPPKSSPAEM